MRDRPWKVVVLIILLTAALAWYVGAPSALEERITGLAGHPGVRNEFRNPETGQGDALITLIGFSILTPIAAFAVAVAVVLIVKALETVLVSLHLPGWFSAPTVAMVGVFTIYATSPSWLPASRYGMGLLARAYVVYVYGPVPGFR